MAKGSVGTEQIGHGGRGALPRNAGAPGGDERKEQDMKPAKRAADMIVRELARYIDQSVLKPEFTVDEIRKYS